MAKCDAIDCFDSQKHRGYCDDNKIISQCITRGMQSDQEFAEVFEVVRINM
jgi:hypothetical protein